MNVWITSGLTLAGGVLVGVVARWAAGAFIRTRDDAPDLARHTGIFAFWFFALAGVVAGVALLNPSTLEALPGQVLTYLPKVLVSGLILIGAWAVAAVVGSIARRSLRTAEGVAGRPLEAAARGAVLAAGVVFAIAQLGIDTTILTIIVGSGLGGLAIAFAALVGLGGRGVAAELAAGRYLSRHLEEGMRLYFAGETVTITQLHPAMLEGTTGDGRRRLVPYSTLLSGGLEVE